VLDRRCCALAYCSSDVLSVALADCDADVAGGVAARPVCAAEKSGGSGAGPRMSGRAMGTS
jgi:hypothetical protein